MYVNKNRSNSMPFEPNVEQQATAMNRQNSAPTSSTASTIATTMNRKNSAPASYGFMGTHNFKNFMNKFKPAPSSASASSARLQQSSIPALSVQKGLDAFCDTLYAKGIHADALQDLKNAIDGKQDLATAPILGQATSTVTNINRFDIENPTTVEEVKGIYDVAGQLTLSFSANYPPDGDFRLEALSKGLINKLIEMSHGNLVSEKTDGFKALQPELEFWHKAEQQLLEQGMPKNKIVATRDKFLNEMKAWKDYASHIDNIADRCISTDRNIYDACSEDIKSLDDLIDDYKKTKTKTNPGASFPKNKEIQKMRKVIDLLDNKEVLEKVNLWSDPNAVISPELVQKYIAREVKVKAAFKKEWKDKWAKATLEPIYQKLKGWPQSLVDELKGNKDNKGIELQTLVAADQKTKYIDGAGQEGMNFRQAWTLDVALSEANKLGVNQKLNAADAVKLREWTSSYLGAAIGHMEQHYV